MADEKTFLLKVELDTSGLVERSEEASKKLVVLKERQKELKKSGEENSVEYAKLKEEIKQYNKQLNDSASALVIADQQNGKSKQSLQDLAKVQKVLAVQFNQLTQEEIENTESGRKIAQQYKEVNEALNKTSLSVGDGRRNVGQYTDSIVKAYKELDLLKKEVTQIGFAYGQTKNEIDENKSALDDMTKSGQSGTQAFIKLQSETEELTEILTFQESALKGATQELTNQEAQLKATEKEARKIGFVYGQTTDATEELGEANADLSAKFEDVYGDLQPLSSRMGELEDRLYELALAGDTSSDKFKEIQAEVVKMKQALIEVDKSTDALAENTGISGFAGLIGETGERLLALDFKGAQQRIDSLRQMSDKTNFKSMIEGAKNMGSSLIELGKTILKNPLFLLVAVITAVGFALYEFSESLKTAEEDAENLNKSIERQNVILDAQAERLNRNAKFQVDKAKAQKKTIEEIQKLEEDALKTEGFTNELRIKNLEEQRQKRFNIIAQAVKEENEEVIKAETEKALADAETIKKLKANREKYNQDLELLRINNQNAINDANEKEVSAQKEKNKKAFEDSKKKKEDELKLAEEIAKRIRELQLSSIELTNASERTLIDNEAEFKRKVAELSIQDEKEKLEALLQIQNEQNAKIEALNLKDKDSLINRIKDKEQEEIKASKGTAEQKEIQNKEIRFQALKEIEAVEQQFENDKLTRQQEALSIEKTIQDEIKNIHIKTNEEILTDLQASLQKQTNEKTQAGKTENEILIENSALEIEIARQTNKIIQDDDTKSKAEKRLSEEEFQAKLIEINKRSSQIKIDEAKTELEKKKELNEAYVNLVSSLTNTAFQLGQNQITEELNAVKNANDEKQASLQNQLDSGFISQAEFNEKKKELDAKARKEQAKLNKKAFELSKIQSVVNATINTAVGVTKALATSNPILAGIVAGLGAVEIGVILSQQTPEFAKGGKVVSGKKIESSDGRPTSRKNGDNLLASVKTGEVILNERQQFLLGGDKTFQRIGVPGFASGGLVGGQISSEISNQFEASDLIIQALKNAPSPVVLVQDINDAQETLSSVENSANI